MKDLSELKAEWDKREGDDDEYVRALEAQVAELEPYKALHISRMTISPFIAPKIS